MTSLRTVARLICVTSVLLLGGVAAADTVILQPSKDNTLYEPIQKDSLEIRSNAAGKSMFTGRTKDALNAGGQEAVRRAVLAFDIAGSGIPAGSTIDSVQLNLRCTKSKLNTGFAVRLHELQSDWGEGTSNTGNSQQGRGELATTGDATWPHTFYDTQFWTTPGGDYDGTASATTAVGGIGDYTWGSTSGMVADVQGWLDNPSQNFGWIIVGDETQNETAKQFATRENTGNGGADKPELIVNYTPLVISGGCCQAEVCSIETPAECTTLGGVYEGDGTSCSPNPCVEPYGACCASNGTCTEDTQSTCEGGGGVFQGDASTCGTVECEVLLTPYVDALPVPGPATPASGVSGGVATYDITMKEFQQQMHSELPPTTVWGYDDGTGPFTPGPVIEASTDNPVTVNWINDLREFGVGTLRTDHYLQQSADDLTCIHGAQDQAKTVVHLHGGHVPAAVDGYPESTFLPGAPAEQYVYPNGQQAAPLWFHDHALGITRLNVYMGLAGLYVMRDAVESALNLPTGGYEVPLVLQDRKFNPDGSYFYPGTWQDMFFGDKVMVNGKVWPYLNVDKGKYRFRLLNGSGSRVYTLSLNPPSGTLTFTVIGNEGGLLAAPAPGVSALTIGPGERYEVVVDFAGYATNDEILLENSAPAPFPNGSVDLTQVMKFVVTNQAGDTDAIPNPLRTVEQLQEGDAIQTRDFELKKSGLDACGRALWEINGLHWDDVTEYPDLGTTEIWRFINDSGVSHPMHMHLVFFQILDRDGFTRDGGGNIVPDGNPQAPALEESGWKDTAMVGPNEILRVIARFEDYKGLYAYHCHILEHEDHEMMRQFQTIDCGDGILDPTEECDDGNTTPGDCCSATCTIEPASTECRAAVDVCDLAEVCDGVSDTCPADAKSTAECRPAVDVCDVAESCDGVSDSCPADGFEPPTTECRISAGVCDPAENCTGAAAACPADTKSTAECRAAADVCDVAESCDGVGNDCPADGFEPPTTECRISAGVCDPAENCTGAAAACPADTKSTAECRAAVDVCDAAESCDGLGNDCPADGFAPDGTPCDDVDACTDPDECASGVCTAGPPPDCDDLDPCTADACDSISGCTHDPIPLCATPIPSTTAWGRVLIGTMLAAAAALLVAERRRGRA